MFSKALFKQSCKANGVMWSIITAAVCFMLACVMLISGSGNIADVKNAVEDTIIVETINSQMEKQALTFYDRANVGAKYFDNSFVLEFKNEYQDNISKANEYQTKTDAWIASMPKVSDYEDLTQYQAAMLAWKAKAPAYDENSVEKYHIYLVSQWLEAAPKQSDYSLTEDYQKAVAAWMEQKPTAAY